MASVPIEARPDRSAPAPMARRDAVVSSDFNDERQGADVDWANTGVLIGLLVGILGGLGGVTVFARVRGQTARALGEDILVAARREAETIRKEAEIQSKEEAIRRREVLDSEVEEIRQGLREQEKRLEKRADLLDQKLDLINKKEREFESVQRYLAEQQEDLTRRNAEVKQVLAEQREALHRIAQLDPDEARDAAAPPPRGRAAARGRRSDPQARADAPRDLPAESARDPRHGHPALRRAAHRRDDRQHRRYPQPTT